MFKVPDFEPDVPNFHVEFSKLTKKRKGKSNDTTADINNVNVTNIESNQFYNQTAKAKNKKNTKNNDNVFIVKEQNVNGKQKRNFVSLNTSIDKKKKKRRRNKQKLQNSNSNVGSLNNSFSADEVQNNTVAMTTVAENAKINKNDNKTETATPVKKKSNKKQKRNASIVINGNMDAKETSNDVEDTVLSIKTKHSAPVVSDDNQVNNKVIKDIESKNKKKKNAKKQKIDASSGDNNETLNGNNVEKSNVNKVSKSGEESKKKSPKKRKSNGTVVNGDTDSGFNIKAKDLDLDIADELMVRAKKEKLNETYLKEDKEDVLFSEIKPKTVERKSVTLKKLKLKKLLEKNDVNRNSIKVNGNSLRERMLERLKAAQFRYLNEKLYTTTGSEAQKLFQSDPSAFHTYHQGYQQQLKKWPVNPLDVIVKMILKMPKTHIIADMGCGEAALSRRVPHSVRSFDLVSTAAGVEPCDMAHTPLLADSVDVAVYCLALMGTQLTQYLVEANRVLKMGGQLLIAEVESRFDNVESFTKDVEKLGFKLKKLDKSHQVFFFMHFVKVRSPPKKSKQPELSLKPCLYKKR